MGIDKVKSPRKDRKVRNAVIVSVISTLLVVTAFAVTFTAGMNYERGQNAEIQSAIKSAK